MASPISDSSVMNAASPQSPPTGPLHGRRIAVTRSREQAGRLTAALQLAGAQVIELPMTRYEPPASWSAVDEVLARMNSFAWIAFTSANGVAFTVQRAIATARTLKGPAIAAVGEATAEAVRAAGLTADIVPAIADAAAVAQALIKHERSVTNHTAAIFQADNARPVLQDTLRASGWTVSAVSVYQAIPLAIDDQVIEAGFDGVTFASAATVQRFVSAVGSKRLDTIIQNGCRFYAIGPFTAEAIRAAGLSMDGMAERATIEDLVAVVQRDLGTTSTT